MSIEPAKVWRCDDCGVAETQTGPWALEMIPTPPYGWTAVEHIRMMPPRSSGEGDSKIKMGPSRQSIRKSFCPGCSRALMF